MKTRKALSIALVALLLVAGAFTNPIAAQSGRALFNWIIADRVLVQDGGLTVTGPSVLSTTTVVGTESVSGHLLVSGFVALYPNTVISVTGASTLTPLGSYQPLASAGTVGFGAIATGSPGSILTLINTTNTTITVTDTGSLKLSGNIALGQFDTLLLVSDGTNWIQRGTSNN